ncbi:hypothetical protein ABN702_16040 [Bacillus haimaensis]|uniref:hypothetical protein n=1 Tax=Bacillus haimaensis TaxID=3160967 RepID=UPI003AA9A533
MWKYELKVNGVAVSKDGKAQIQEDSMEISIIQRQPAYYILPDDETEKGKINGAYLEHLSEF